MRALLAAPKHPPLADPAALAAIARAVAEAGHEVVRADAAAGERAAFEATFAALKEADVVIAEASQPSLGVGWVIAQQLAMGRLAIVCVREDARATLNVVIAGNPSPWQRIVTYRDPAELARKLVTLVA